MDAAAERVQRELADRDAHAADAQVAQAEDALAVGHDDHVHLAIGPVRQDRVDLVAVLVREEQPARLAVDPAEVLARLADHRGVDQRHHLGDVVAHQAVEEHLVAVLEVAEVDVLLELGALRLEVVVAAVELLLDRADVRGQQPVQAELGPLVLGEGAPLVEDRRFEQLQAR